MDRRRFLQTAGGAAALAQAASEQLKAQQQQPVSYANYDRNGVIPGSKPADPKVENPPRKAKMHVGTQHTTDDVQLGIISSFGVNHICGTEIGPKLEDWSVDNLSKLKERVEKHGIALSMVPLPLPSAVIGKAEMPAVMMGQSPQRDRDIEALQQMIKNCAKVGIPAVKYNMSILGVQRIGRTPGRGSATYSTWNYEKAPNKDKLTEVGALSADAYWERIDYFLARMVPVAAEYKIRMACHPHDPGMPEPEGYRGVHTVLGSVDGLKKFVSMHENPYHGLNFCQGTVSEMLKDPNREIHDVIRYFGSRKKIFNVHFRNIRGHFSDFVETFPDNGSVNMLAAAKSYYDVDYEYMLMPDHVPVITGDTRGYQAFAFAFGYIQAAIQMFG
jgi:mannonate dehydratase